VHKIASSVRAISKLHLASYLFTYNCANTNFKNFMKLIQRAGKTVFLFIN